MAPVVDLKATVLPTTIVRATVLGDLMANFGIPENVIKTAQQGYADGLIDGIVIRGRDTNGYIRDEVELSFDKLAGDPEIAVDHSGGKSMIEALSVKFAHAVSYSIREFRRRGLTVGYVYNLSARASASPTSYQATLDRYSLTASAQGRYPPGYEPRQVLSVRPGLDPGIRYTHSKLVKKRR